MTPTMKFGTPQGFKEKVLAVIADSSTTLRNKLSVFGFNFNPLGNFWTRPGEFQPHVAEALESLGISPSNAVLNEISSKKHRKDLNRVFVDPNFKYEMLLDYQRDALDFCKRSGSGVIALDIGLGRPP